MKAMIKIKAVALLAAMIATTPAVAQDAELFASSAKLTQKSGEAIYNAICVACHQEGGVGASGAGAYPALAKNDNMAATDFPIHVVLHGQKGMPPLKGVLDDAQIAEVVNYIRGEFNGFNEEPATAEQVAEARK